MNLSSVIGISYFCFALGVVVGNVVHGEQYTFNMTQEQRDETNVLPLCFDTGMEIEMIKEFCKDRYGGIDTPYGDAIKVNQTE